MCDNLLRRGTFVWDLLVSDGLNSGDYGRWDRILFDSNVAKGADYCLYLTPKYVETGSRFQMPEVQSLRIGLIRAGESFSLNLPEKVV